MTSSLARPIRTAIIGLGQVGSRFDEESGRSIIWTHAGAYENLADKFEIVAACEPGADNARAFASRMPDVPIVATPGEIVVQYDPDVVSICTPAETHHDVFMEIIAGKSLKAIWCEKPFAADTDGARRMIAAAEARGVKVIVSHVRRWVPLWRRTADLIAEGAIGTVRCVRIAMPNRILSIGSHAIDLALILGGPATQVTAIDVPALFEEGEAARPAFLQFTSGAYGIVQVTGLKSRLIVEAEVLGDDGRLTIRESDGTVTLEKFELSRNYDSYSELAAARIWHEKTLADFSPFIAAARELAELVGGTIDRPSCSAIDALSVMEIIGDMGNLDSSNAA
jgi:predicted dehydrogenase